MSKLKRWFINLTLIGIGQFLLPLLFPVLTIGVAVWATTHRIGLFNILYLNYYLTVFVSVLILDMVIYFQHVFFHRIPFFWKFHIVHHTDLDLDVTSGLRFHPIEIIFSMLIKLATILLLGIPYQAVILFEIILNMTAMFSHSNIFIPLSIDSLLRRIIVTPDMHRIHHSIYRNETDSNFGFNLSIWDRLFKTYHQEPKKGHLHMTIGLSQYQNETQLSLFNILILPFSLLKAMINQRINK